MIREKKIGQWITYHPFGEVYIREFYENGLRQGPYLEYDQEGNLMTEGVYKEGKLESTFKRYSYAGQVMEEGEYKNGNKVGKWDLFTFLTPSKWRQKKLMMTEGIG